MVHDQGLRSCERTVRLLAWRGPIACSAEKLRRLVIGRLHEDAPRAQAPSKQVVGTRRQHDDARAALLGNLSEHLAAADKHLLAMRRDGGDEPAGAAKLTDADPTLKVVVSNLS